MAIFIFILLHAMFPILFVVALGFVLQRILHFDVRTFTQINLYVFIPAILFVKIYEVEIEMEFLSKLFVYIVGIQFVMLLIGDLIARIFHYPRNKRKAFGNLLLFFNSGNYGLPLIEVLFPGNSVAFASQIFIMLIQKITTSTYGIFQASSGKSSTGKALKKIMCTPLIYIVLSAAVLRGTGLEIPEMIMTPVKYLSSGFVGIGLFTLGVQLAEIKTNINLKAVLPSSFIRLILSPVIGYMFTVFLGIKGELAKAVIIGIAMPSAVNTVILAQEYDNKPEYVAQNVLASTVLSPFSLALLVYSLTFM